MHTKEPWPDYIDVAVVMTPNPDGPDAAVLSFDDYCRAKACVNACAGVPTELLERVGLNWGRLEQVKQQRDELLDALKVASAYLPVMSPQYIGARNAIAKAES